MKSERNRLPDELLDHFVRIYSGESSAADESALREFLGSHPELKEKFESLADLWDKLYLIVPENPISQQPNISRPAPFRRRWPAAGAVATAVIAVLVLGWSQFFTGSPDVFETGRGQRFVTTLDDGSIVHLNSMTRLSVQYADDQREVTMFEGEALFHVVADSHRRFVVKTERGRVEAIGTEFNVRFRRERLQVAVLDGTIKLSTETGPLSGDSGAQIATGGEQIVIDSSGDLSASERVNVSNVSAWTRGQVVFSGETLAEAVETINLHGTYEVKIRDDELRVLRIYGVFNAGDTAGFLSAVEGTLPVRAVQVSDKITTLIAIPRT